MVLFKFKYWIPLIGVYFVDAELRHTIKGDITEQYPLFSLYHILWLIALLLFSSFLFDGETAMSIKSIIPSPLTNLSL